MKKIYLLSAIALGALLITSCEEDDDNLISETENCLETLIQDGIDGCVPNIITQFVYNGDTVYYFENSCSDGYNYVIDSDCEVVCAPSGGITGNSDGNCADFLDSAIYVQHLYGFCGTTSFGDCACCSGNNEEYSGSCSDTVPTNELCEAYFEMWFYDEATQTCTEIGYSGCEEYGFSTQVECEECVGMEEEEYSASCSDTVPTDELCLAYFERWFYDDATQTCTEIGYSGCEEYGFSTQAECEDCANGQ